MQERLLTTALVISGVHRFPCEELSQRHRKMTILENIPDIHCDFKLPPHSHCEEKLPKHWTGVTHCTDKGCAVLFGGLRTCRSPPPLSHKNKRTHRDASLVLEQTLWPETRTISASRPPLVCCEVKSPAVHCDFQFFKKSFQICVLMTHYNENKCLNFSNVFSILVFWARAESNLSPASSWNISTGWKASHVLSEEKTGPTSAVLQQKAFMMRFSVLFNPEGHVSQNCQYK